MADNTPLAAENDIEGAIGCTEAIMLQAMMCLDQSFGVGYAASNPVMLAGFMATATQLLTSAALLDAGRDMRETLLQLEGETRHMRFALNQISETLDRP